MTEVNRDRRAERHQATRQEILDAAWKLAAEQGLTGWSLKDLADAVGMRAPSLYVYFASKAEIYDALFASGYEDLRALIDATRRPKDPRRLLRLAARTFIDFAIENPARYQLLFLRTVPGFEPSPTSYQLALETLDDMRVVLKSAGAVRGADLDLWTALVTGLASQQISNDPGGTRWKRLADEAVEMFVAGRLSRPRSAPPTQRSDAASRVASCHIPVS